MTALVFIIYSLTIGLLSSGLAVYLILEQTTGVQIIGGKAYNYCVNHFNLFGLAEGNIAYTLSDANDSFSGCPNINPYFISYPKLILAGCNLIISIILLICAVPKKPILFKIFYHLNQSLQFIQMVFLFFEPKLTIPCIVVSNITNISDGLCGEGLVELDFHLSCVAFVFVFSTLPLLVFHNKKVGPCFGLFLAMVSFRSVKYCNGTTLPVYFKGLVLKEKPTPYFKEHYVFVETPYQTKVLRLKICGPIVESKLRIVNGNHWLDLGEIDMDKVYSLEMNNDYLLGPWGDLIGEILSTRAKFVKEFKTKFFGIYSRCLTKDEIGALNAIIEKHLSGEAIHFKKYRKVARLAVSLINSFKPKVTSVLECEGVMKLKYVDIKAAGAVVHEIRGEIMKIEAAVSKSLSKVRPLITDSIVQNETVCTVQLIDLAIEAGIKVPKPETWSDIVKKTKYKPTQGMNYISNQQNIIKIRSVNEALNQQLDPKGMRPASRRDTNANPKNTRNLQYLGQKVLELSKDKAFGVKNPKLYDKINDYTKNLSVVREKCHSQLSRNSLLAERYYSCIDRHQNYYECLTELNSDFGSNLLRLNRHAISVLKDDKLNSVIRHAFSKTKTHGITKRDLITSKGKELITFKSPGTYSGMISQFSKPNLDNLKDCLRKMQKKYNRRLDKDTKALLAGLINSYVYRMPDVLNYLGLSPTSNVASLKKKYYGTYKYFPNLLFIPYKTT